MEAQTTALEEFGEGATGKIYRWLKEMNSTSNRRNCTLKTVSTKPSRTYVEGVKELVRMAVIRVYK